MNVLIETSPYMISCSELKDFVKSELKLKFVSPKSLGQFKTAIEMSRTEDIVILNSLYNIFSVPGQKYEGERLITTEVKMLYAILLEEALKLKSHCPIILGFNGAKYKKMSQLRTRRTIAQVIMDIVEVKLFYNYAYEEFPNLTRIEYEEIMLTPVKIENYRRIKKCLYCQS